MTESVEAVVIGAGVVGLAVARALALSGREVIVLEKETLIGSGTSSRNSEVIHAGIYYPANSLMAKFCVSGRDALYAYCEERGIPHKRIGKLIVATDDEEASRLDSIAARAAANGVNDLKRISAEEALELEPALNTTGALLSPSTGIIDSHAYMLALQGDAENAGSVVAFGSTVTKIKVAEDGFYLSFAEDSEMRLHTRVLVNAAGLFAPGLAATMGLPPEFSPRAYYARGCYFSLAARSPFSRLIYPLPVPGALGVHLTLDLAKQVRFGPDIEWIDGIDYTVDPSRSDVFYDAIRRYWPGLPDESLVPSFSGIRPKIVPPSVASQDFRIDGPETHGIPGLVNLFGIESPGLTSSLSIAECVIGKLI